MINRQRDTDKLIILNAVLDSMLEGGEAITGAGFPYAKPKLISRVSTQFKQDQQMMLLGLITELRRDNMLFMNGDKLEVNVYYVGMWLRNKLAVVTERPCARHHPSVDRSVLDGLFDTFNRFTRVVIDNLPVEALAPTPA